MPTWAALWIRSNLISARRGPNGPKPSTFQPTWCVEVFLHLQSAPPLPARLRRRRLADRASRSGRSRSIPHPIWPSRTLESQSTDEGSRRHRGGPVAFCSSPPSCAAEAAVCTRTGRRGAAKPPRAAAPARLRRRGRRRGGDDSLAAEPTAEKGCANHWNINKQESLINRSF
ncbi:hypothetical protein PAHAL_6G285900 [Panicum hallii]|uniref:Uncharacterized protein n=1 Tax=Panicum hallii TaxID=206008 RepID=A0A2T8II37_9POAL|nr:hypothetical protein PAHAL_6G285900 [Panicum hallii]